MLGPIVAGLWGTVLPAFGHLPAAGRIGPSVEPLRALLNWPGLLAASRLSITTGFLATSLSLLIVVLITAGWSGSRLFRLMQHILSPLLSVPHAAAAFGLTFLIAPSGWVARILSPWATGWERPPDLLITQDPWGFALVLGLVVKEVPFLLLMTLAALGQIPHEQRLNTSLSLGHGRVSGWLVSVFPSVYAQIRLPVYVVLAYSMSVVDVALILGPTTPSTLSVQIVGWMGDPDLTKRLTGAAAALLQLGLVLGALLLWRLGEALVRLLGLLWVEQGVKSRFDPAGRAAALGLGLLSALTVLFGLLGLVVWSVAGFWGFPDALPAQVSAATWMRHGPEAAGMMWQTYLIAFAATALALVLVLGCLEAEHRSGRPMSRRGVWLIYLPLLIPQTAFLPGLQTWLLSIGADTGPLPVIFSHMVFVLPYIFLSLGDAWRSWDPRYARIAASAGASPARVFWVIRLPMLLRPILTAVAVGLAVSIGQYLPTLLIGGGRVATLTTEAVALASGGDRRAIGLYGLMQTLAALLPFAFALAIPAIAWRNRRGLYA